MSEKRVQNQVKAMSEVKTDGLPAVRKDENGFLDYTPGVGERIAQIMQKKLKSWEALSKLEGMPSLLQMQYWYKTSKKFKELMDMADQVVAREAFESVVKSSKSTRDLHKDEVPAEKLWFEQQKFIMEKSDPSRFGQKGSQESGATQINIVLPFDYNKEVDISDIVDVRKITNVPDPEEKEPTDEDL